MTNLKLAGHILTLLKKWGVEDIVLCPGGRNAPFVVSLENTNQFKIHGHFDERSASFFALGRTRAKQKPVAVITTSGTAAAEVLPAVIEAHYTQTPLIVITADRPRNLRGTGAPQAIEQKDLFANYVEKSLDIEVPWEGSLATWSSRAPLHINVCFDEPLLDGDIEPVTESLSPYATPAFPLMKWRGQSLENVSLRDLCDEFQKFTSACRSPLLIVSDLEGQSLGGVSSFIKNWSGLVYFEGLSGWRETSHPGKLQSGEHFLRKLLRDKKIDSIVRLGGVPTTRLWRDIEKTKTPCFSLSMRPFSGLSKGQFYWLDNQLLSELLPCLPKLESSHFNEILKEDKKIQETWAGLLEKYPLSEPSWMRWVSGQISEDANVYVGNSSPIRQWDLFAQPQGQQKVLASRGANGIDGQISTAQGYLSEDKDLWVVVGDLTALYDSNSLWQWQQNKDLSLKLVVVNNRGGKIFKRIFESPLFHNQHEISFDHWAQQWGLPYFQCPRSNQSDRKAPGEKSWLLEINPDEEQTSQFWQDYDKLFQL